MRDPCGLCMRRSSFSHARSRVSRSEASIPAGCNEIGPSDKHDDLCQFPLFSADDEFCSLPAASRRDLLENASAGWLADASKNGPPKRSRSCSGRIEASSIYAKSYIRKQLSLRTDRTKVSRSISTPEPVSARPSRRPICREILELSLKKRIKVTTKEEKSKDPFQEKHALECRTSAPRLVTRREYDTEKAAILLLPVFLQKATKTCTSSVPLCPVIRKRRFEKEDGDITIKQSYKKPRQRNKELKSPTGYPNTVESLGIRIFHPTFKPSRSNFQPSSQ